MHADPVDRATLDELAASLGQGFVAELAGTFLAEAPALLGALRRALADGDAESFRRAAHTLKSNAHTFGAAELGARAKALEQGGLAHARATAGALDDLEREYERVARALAELGHG